MTKEVGCYNITFCGLSYDNNIPCDMVIIEKFNNNTYIEGSKKVLYFRHERGCIVPVFNTEKEVEKYLQYRNYEKLKVKKSITIEIV
jgi:hypothetical protein